MSTHEQISQNPERKHRGIFQFRQYENTDSSFYVDEPGAVVQLGLSSTFKHSRDFHSSDMALIYTASGNKYGIYRGWAYNFNAEKAARLPDGGLSFDDTIKIGDRWIAPTGHHTTQVVAVEMAYKTGSRQLDAEQIPKSSPFDEVLSIVHQLDEKYPPQ